jgi:hypothetical protein
MKYTVVDAHYLHDYQIAMTFEDGKHGIVDLSEYTKRGGVFANFGHIDYFKNFTIDYGTLVWDGEVDIAPERLYEKAV